MITLLLTSQGLQVKDEILKILPKPPNEIKLAISLLHQDL
jgi:hypothetical protein